MVHLLGVFRLPPRHKPRSKYSCLVWQVSGSSGLVDIFKWQQCSGLDFEQHIHCDKSHIQTKTKLRWHNKKHVHMMNKWRKNTRLGKQSIIPLKRFFLSLMQHYTQVTTKVSQYKSWIHKGEKRVIWESIDVINDILNIFVVRLQLQCQFQPSFSTEDTQYSY